MDTATNSAFSIPAYIVAVVSGSVSMALLFLVYIKFPVLIFSRDAVMLVLSTIAFGIVSAIPSLAVFLPLTLFSFHISKRYGISSIYYYMLSGAVSSVATGSVFVIPMAYGNINFILVFLLELALAGALAGLAYRWVANLEQSKRKAFI